MASGTLTGKTSGGIAWTYVGEIKNGVPNGVGRKDWIDGAWYEGEWLDGSWHGKGTYFSEDGDKYEGGWRENEKHGQGKYTFADGETQVGGFIRNRFDEGTYCGTNGNIIGKYLDGMFFDYGSFKSKFMYMIACVLDKFARAVNKTARASSEWNKKQYEKKFPSK